MPDGAEPSIRPAGPNDQDAGPIQTEEGPRGLFSFLTRFLGQRNHDINDVLHQATANGSDLSPAERAMVTRILAFNDKRVDDVAIPRVDIVGVEVDVSLSELLTCFSGANHSRLPVYRGDLDDPIGMVHIKDVVGLLADPDAGEDVSSGPILETLIRKILYVPPSMPVTDLLLRMQASRVHMALVIDEFGGTDGLLTIEDLIELIVGDIRDEHDEPDTLEVRRLGEGKWDADARVRLEEVAAETKLPVETVDHEADTLGGLVFSLAGRVPLRGEVISHPNGPEFEICEADPRRIRRVIIRAQAKRRENDLHEDEAKASVASVTNFEAVSGAISGGGGEGSA
ncbi:MAG: hemolysin family protein [Pseudomonadota bacterium]